LTPVNPPDLEEFPTRHHFLPPDGLIDVEFLADTFRFEVIGDWVECARPGSVVWSRSPDIGDHDWYCWHGNGLWNCPANIERPSQLTRVQFVQRILDAFIQSQRGENWTGKASLPPPLDKIPPGEDPDQYILGHRRPEDLLAEYKPYTVFEPDWVVNESFQLTYRGEDPYWELHEAGVWVRTADDGSKYPIVLPTRLPPGALWLSRIADAIRKPKDQADARNLALLERGLAPTNHTKRAAVLAENIAKRTRAIELLEQQRARFEQEQSELASLTSFTNKSAGGDESLPDKSA
jgi:hypothetical protein